MFNNHTVCSYNTSAIEMVNRLTIKRKSAFYNRPYEIAAPLVKWRLWGTTKAGFPKKFIYNYSNYGI